MRNTFFSMLAAALVLTACSKSKDKCPYTTSTAAAGTAEIANLKLWLDTNSIPYTQLPSGVFYNVLNAGTGATPGVCSDITVKYKGQLTNGAGFDSSYVRDPEGTSFTLGALIPGWQIGIPVIKAGGSVILYVPPSLGYGAAANGPIPANSNLVFKIDLINVN